MKQRVFLSALGIVNALGCGFDEVAHGLFAGDTTGMMLEDGWLSGKVDTSARVGRARGVLPDVPTGFADFDCRNNRLLLCALGQIQQSVDDVLTRYGRERIGVVLGSSTTGMAEGEMAIAAYRANGVLPPGYSYLQQELGMPAVFLARYLGLEGPAYTVCTACTSSAKAIISARSLLRYGFCDAVLVGGVDSLCRTTINGFNSLGSTTTNISNPMSRNRNGINVGEGAAIFLMSGDEAAIELIGIGESSDAYHMSAPRPDGLGAELAMRAALVDAGLTTSSIDYLNLHATATPKNDEMESRAVASVFSNGIATSGTKPLTGHTLGAAGAIELAFCWMSLQAGRLPPHIWDGQPDLNLPQLDLVRTGQHFVRDTRRVCMSNSFAFGGSNASLLIGDYR